MAPARTRFSAILPLYNKARHIGRAIASAQRALAGFAHEIVVVDDGSTDGGGAAVARMAAADPAIRLMTQANAGRGAACNRAAAAARGEILMFLDCDDEWTPGHARGIDALARRFPAATVYAAAYSEVMPDGTPRRMRFAHVPDAPDGGIVARYFAACAAGAEPLSSSGAAVRAATYAAHGGFPEAVALGEDRVLWVRLALAETIAWTPAIGAVYRRDADNRLMATWKPGADDAVLEEIDRQLARPGLPAGLRADLALARAHQLKVLFNNHVETGLRRAALPYLAAHVRARGLGPSALLILKALLPKPAVAAARRAFYRLRR